MMKQNLTYLFHKKILLLRKYTEEAFGIFLLLPVRIRMKMEHRRKPRVARETVQHYQKPVLTPRNNVWHEKAILPGNPKLLPSNSPESWLITPPDPAFTDLLVHRLTVLSPDNKDINHSAPSNRVEIKKIVPNLSENRIATYQPIDWHKDFKSAHRWDQNSFYLNIKVAPVSGADIKVPRELSRFQHVGVLARGPRNEGAEEFILQVADWISANPYGYGVNWACTMDVALRAVNWIWGMRFFEDFLKDHPETVQRFATSLHQHGKYIENNLEYYKGSTGNHYLSDIVGLLYIGSAFPEFEESDRWVLFAMQELVSEMEREVYADGGAHEASTHYHRLVAELFTSGSALCERFTAERKRKLLLVDVKQHQVDPELNEPAKTQLNLEDEGRVFPRSFYSKLAKMGEFSKALTKPNKLVPQFGDNDSARVHKIFPSPDDRLSDHHHVILAIESMCQSKSLTGSGSGIFEADLLCGDIEPLIPPSPTVEIAASVLFPETGIAILRNNDAFLAVTCGTNGQLGRGGHGHNDKLSFELNVHGLDYIVDGGCPVYTANPKMRNQYRGTAAHSTIYIEGEEQDAWQDTLNGLFVLRERSFPKLKVEGNQVIGSHFGFEVPHHRNFILDDSCLTIRDHFPTQRKRIMSFNLHPEVTIVTEKSDNSAVKFRLIHLAGKQLLLEIDNVDLPEIGPGFFSNGYGVPISTAKLSVQLIGEYANTKITWNN